MGGVKKKPMAAMEKNQDGAEQPSGDEAKGKKGEKKSAPQQRKQLAVIAPRLSDEAILKSISPLRAITAYGASRALGVNASVAVVVLRQLEAKGLITKSGGFSGHSVWAVARAA